MYISVPIVCIHPSMHVDYPYTYIYHMSACCVSYLLKFVSFVYVCRGVGAMEIVAMDMKVCTPVCTVYVCMCVCVGGWICVCVGVGVGGWVWVWVCLCVHMYIRLCMHVCVHTCMYVHAYTHVHTYSMHVNNAYVRNCECAFVCFVTSVASWDVHCKTVKLPWCQLLHQRS